MSVFRCRYLMRLIKTEVKWLIVGVKYHSDNTEKKRARIRNQMWARLKSSLGTFLIKFWFIL